MRSSGVLVILGLIGWFGTAAQAEDDFAASLRLRGGFDSNPQFSSGSGVGSSGFIGSDIALAAGTKAEGYSYGVAAEASNTRYLNPLTTPALTGRIVLRGTYGDDARSISSTSTIADANTFNLRSSDLIQSFKGEATIDTIKVFATVEGAHSSLNQTNAIFQSFSPNTNTYLRGTFIPGVAYVRGKFEVGTSVNMSAQRYERALDDFGYHRDNERVQPYLFGKYEDKNITLAGSISQLYGKFHDIDFSNVDRTLFDAKLNWRISPVTIDFSAFRRAGETSFPVSPITIDTGYIAKLSWQVEPKLTLTTAAGYATTDYLDSRFSARTLTWAIGGSRDLGDNYALGLDLTFARGVLISGDKASTMIVSSSLTKTFMPFAKASKDALKDKKAIAKS